MGDGVSARHGLFLCTDSYSIQETIKLMNILKIRYNIDSTLNYHTKTQPRIYIKESSMKILQNLTETFMHSSMLYKIKK
jgi:hypothetical protein